MVKKQSQHTRLVELLEKNPTVTVQFIEAKLQVNSPRKLLSDLKKLGYPIKSRWLNHLDQYGYPVRYKEYWLEKNQTKEN